MCSILLVVNGCKKSEEQLSPTPVPEPGYSIPQGNNDYDQRIVSYFNKWGTYVLYKFSQQDINWTPTTLDTWYKTQPAIEAYVNPQLDLLEDTFFKYYADSTLKKYLPLKIFLCSSLTVGTATVQANAFYLTLDDTHSGGYQSFGVNGGNSTVSTINKSLYRADMNFAFLKMMDLDAKIKKSDLFLTITDYVTAVPANPADRYKRGFLNSIKVTTSSLQDWHSFIQVIVSNPYSYLTDPATTAADGAAKGILTPVKDVNGLIKRKYDAMINHYKGVYGIDLQRIGNGF